MDRQLAKRIQSIFHKIDSEYRKALINNAWMGSPIINQVDYSGNKYVFSHHLFHLGNNFGFLDDDEHALVALLREIDTLIGDGEDRQEIQFLIKQIEEMDKAQIAQKSKVPIPQNTNLQKPQGNKQSERGRETRAQQLFDRGSQHQIEGNPEQAIANYDEAIYLNPGISAYYTNRGVACVTLKRYDEAINNFTKAIKLNHKDSNAYNNRGLVNAKFGRYSQAIADYNKAIEIDPNYASPYQNLGNLYYETNRYTEAFEAYLIYKSLNKSLDSDTLRRIEKIQAMEPLVVQTVELKHEIDKLKNVTGQEHLQRSATNNHQSQNIEQGHSTEQINISWLSVIVVIVFLVAIVSFFLKGY